MGRTFDGASDWVIGHTSPQTPTDNWTLSAWVNHNSAAATSVVYFNGTSSGGGGNGYAIRVAFSTPNYFAQADLSFVAAATGTTALAAGTWYHIVAVRRSGTTYVYTNGTQNGTTTASSPNTPGSHYTIGARNGTDGIGSRFKGDIGECAMWDVALTDAEIASLADGFSALFIRPQKLSSYVPLVGNDSPETDRVSPTALTVTGTPTKADHPRVLYPAGFQTYAVASGGAPALGNPIGLLLTLTYSQATVGSTYPGYYGPGGYF